MPSEPVPPVPLLAELDEASPTLKITFDLPLQVGGIFSDNIRVIGPTFLWAPDGGDVPAGEPTTVVYDLVEHGATSWPPATTDYSALPPDLIGQNGLPVASFIGFPTTVL